MESQNPLEKAQLQICPGDIAKTKEPQILLTECMVGLLLVLHILCIFRNRAYK